MGMEARMRKPYPSDVSDDEWAFVAPYLTLMTETAPQRHHELRELFNGLRYVVKTGAPWRWMPNDLPPWEIVYQQAQRWLRAGCFETLAEDLRVILRLAAGRAEQPTAAVIDSRTLRSTPESGARAGYDGAKRKRGSKVHMAVDTLGHLLALHVTPADAARAQGIKLHVVKLPEAKRGFVLLPRRWVVERSFGWATRFRRLVKDYERYASTLAGFHTVAF